MVLGENHPKHRSSTRPHPEIGRLRSDSHREVSVGRVAANHDFLPSFLAVEADKALQNAFARLTNDQTGLQ